MSQERFFLSGNFLRLSVMMFIQFFIWGAWFTSAQRYMEANGMGGATIGVAFGFAWGGAIVSPFIVGMIADRFFATQKVLGVLHLLGGGLILLAPTVVEPDGSAAALFIALIFLHMICYMPTINLTNSISFSNLSSSEKQFPMVRVFGTIGWIAAGLIVSSQGWDDQASVFQLAGGVALAMGLYCFTLPHTPPPAAGRKVSVRDVLGLDALVMLKERSYLIFAVSSFLICIPLSAYYAYTPNFLAALGIERTAGMMTIGQMSEVFFMIAMPWFFVRLGVKWMLLVGMMAWVARYGLFAIGAVPEPALGLLGLVIIGVALHGICYDFFFVTGYIYADQKAPPAIRASAQGFLIWITLGWGMTLGSWLTGAISTRAFEDVTDPLRQWKTIWLILAAIAGVVMVIFWLMFRERKGAVEPADEAEVAATAAAEEQP